MAKRGRPRSKPASQGLLDRLSYYRRMIFRDSQRLMADALGLSPSYLSKVFTGAQPPSHAFLESLARHPMVSGDWLFREEGIPLLPSTAGTLPGTTMILPGPPTENPDLLSGNRFPAPAALERDSVYYLTLQPTSPLVRQFPGRFHPGDRLAIETARAVLDRVDAIDGQLCAVITLPGAQECVMAVVFARSGELLAQRFDEPVPEAKPGSKRSGKGPMGTLVRKLNPSKKTKGAGAETQQPAKEPEATSEDQSPAMDTDLPLGLQRLDGPHQVVGLALRLERDGPLCPVHVPEQRVRTPQSIETKEEETANRFGETDRPEKPIWGRGGGWSHEDDPEERVRVPESG